LNVEALAFLLLFIACDVTPDQSDGPNIGNAINPAPPPPVYARSI